MGGSIIALSTQEGSMRKDVEDLIQECRQAAIEEVAQGFDDALVTFRDVCESPIEVALLAAFHYREQIKWAAPSVTVHHDEPPDDLDVRRSPGLHVYLQASILTYRADFVVDLVRSEQRIERAVIECDGHDFHERTKEQAARDRKRDREMTAAGYVVLRFTGAEIWRSPLGCMNQIVQALVKIGADSK